MIATVLLIINFCFLFIKDKALFSFWHFVWIYLLEMGIYALLASIWYLIVKKFDKEERW